jgi:cation-transporting ATPase E
VAMTGDGVNDLLALKQSDVGVAMGSGSAASRSVAQFVLLGNEFGAMPKAVGEGRRVIGNVERVAKLFLVKSVYAFVLAVAVGIAQLPFPLLPRHLSLVAALTVGIPGFFLALEPNDQVVRTGFVSRTLDFSIPTGLVAAVATFVAYADLGADGLTIDQSRTAATIVVFAVGMWALTAVARPINAARAVLLAAMNVAFVVALALPSSQTFFALELPPAAQWPYIATVAVVAVTCAELLHRRVAIYTWSQSRLRRPVP